MPEAASAPETSPQMRAAREQTKRSVKQISSSWQLMTRLSIELQSASVGKTNKKKKIGKTFSFVHLVSGVHVSEQALLWWLCFPWKWMWTTSNRKQESRLMCLPRVNTFSSGADCIRKDTSGLGYGGLPWRQARAHIEKKWKSLAPVIYLFIFYFISTLENLL